MDASAPNSQQILVFLKVVDHGSFSAAARHLQRAQSAVTYAIQQLESDLGVALFDRSGRRPLLTPAGNALVGNARRIAQELSSIQRRARGLNQGLEAELTLVADSIFPMSNLLDIVRAFSEKFPTVPVRIFVETLGAPAKKILDRTCMVGIVGPIVTHGQDFGVFSPMALRATDLGAKHQMILAGPGGAACRATLSRQTCVKTVW